MDIPGKGSLVEIKWLDAFNPDPKWKATDTIKIKKKCTIYTAGYLVGATEEYLVVARDKAKGQYSGIFHIPLPCVKTIRRPK